MVSLDEQHAASMSLMQIENDYASGLFDDGKLDRGFLQISLMMKALLDVANAAFVKQYVVASMTFTPSYVDDCLATMQAFSDQFLEQQSELGPGPALANRDSFSYQFLGGFSRILELGIDYSINPQHLQLLANLYLQKLLSAQAAFGYSGEYSTRPLPAMVAYTMLNTRYIAYSFATVLSKQKPTESELRNPGIRQCLLPYRRLY